MILAGLLWRRANGVGALTGFLGGVACSVTLFALNQESVYSALGWPPLFRVRNVLAAPIARLLQDEPP